jgi:hypothetical protein
MRKFRIPHSAFRIPHSAFRIPHSIFHIPQYLCRPHRGAEANWESPNRPAEIIPIEPARVMPGRDFETGPWHHHAGKAPLPADVSHQCFFSCFVLF